MRQAIVRRAATTPGLLALLAAAALPAPAEAKHPAPPAPVLLDPAEDAQHQKCFLPDAEQGIKFTWRLDEGGEGAASPIAAYISIERWEGNAIGWHKWIGQYARPPFTMLVRPRVYDASFAWRVWAVDRSGKSKPYATPSAWRLFCTLPEGEPPPYGSSRPTR